VPYQIPAQVSGPPTIANAPRQVLPRLLTLKMRRSAGVSLLWVPPYSQASHQMSNLESGSCFDLPWVSTIGVGPNGRTVSGVTYRFGINELNSTPWVLENKSS